MKHEPSKESNPRLRPLVLVGGGGHCRSLIDVLEAEGVWQIAGLVDLSERQNEDTLGYPRIGADEDLPELARKYPYFLIAAGQIGLPALRERMYKLITNAGGKLATVCSPLARVSPHATIGEGTVVFHQAVVNAGATVGGNVIVNTFALIEHDVRVGVFCHISTGSRVNGGCVLADRCFVGSGAVLRENVRLAEGTIVGCGAVVVRDTEPFGVYAGVPARLIKKVLRRESERNAPLPPP
jgi:sugar O-acyltransferase (sialic acid O-acetyltransferase NeuD family)